MNKDLSKEYKEAVMNDLPDLWGRIEAAIDAEESAKTNGNETPASNVINFSKPENNTAVTANKYAVNAYDNEPVKGQEQKKKKFRIPAWVFVAIPSAAILLVVMIPVGLLMMSGGMGNKSATTAMMDMAAPASVTTASESATDAAASYDASPAMEEPAIMEEAEEYVYSDSEPEARENAATATPDFTGATEKNETKQNVDYTLDLKNVSEGDFNNLLPPSAGESDIRIINDDVSVKFLSVYENDEGVCLAEVEITGVLGDYDYIPDDFQGFEEGMVLTAYMLPLFEDTDLTGEEYNCIVRYLSDDEIGYVIEPVNED
ncbi:MAG: hypothetical protein J6X80_03075 [Lachnospiraceae bacterium]|nr:hypothetical protein [Lachnospiraceae bacterium]